MCGIVSNGNGHAGYNHTNKENAMIKNVLMISAFTLVFAVSAFAQEGLRRGNQRFMGQQQRHDIYQQQRRRE